MKFSAKNHTISKIIAKTLLRLFIILLAFASYPLFLGKEANSKLGQINLAFTNKVALIAPILLFCFIIGLMIAVLKHKYNRIDLNWLFSLATIFGILYLILLYSRIYPTIV
jgi:flagellar biosynthesis protein FliQ